MDAKIYCLDPVRIVNPKMVGFVLSSTQMYYHDRDGIHPYSFNPSNWNNMRTSALKDNLKHRIKRFLKYNQSVNYFMNQDGCCLDAYIEVPCGHCLLCTERKKKSFAAKCIMETQLHDYLPEFVTLTYAPEHLPKKGVNYRDVQLFLKRVRINLERKYGFTGKITYAVGCEYGNPKKTFRPHYHLLIWGIPRHRGQPLWNYINVWDFFKECWSLGNVQYEHCKDSNAAYYVGKYMGKETKIPKGCNAPVHRTSINLGVDFVMDKAAGVLRANPEYTEVKYCDRFTGKVCRIPMVKYFIDHVFPTYTSSVSVEVRNALRDYNTCYETYGLSLDTNLTLLEEEVEAYKDTKPDRAKLASALLVLKSVQGKEFPDFATNQAKREKYYLHLFDNLGDIDLEHVAYKLSKKQAKDKDKEIF